MRSLTGAGPIPAGCVHAEAFRLLRYRSENRDAEELIWNSRDGKAPECIRFIDGSFARHVNSTGGDPCLPSYRPQVGERVFVALEPDRVAILAGRLAGMIERGEANAPSSSQMLNAAVEALLWRELEAGAPELRVVTADLASAHGWADPGRESAHAE